jgi:cell growth-regulating nucleolar protein
MNGSVPPQQLGGGYGGRGRGGGGGGWGRPRTVATGANDTPLGTPTRSSPLPTPVQTPHSAPKRSDDAVKQPLAVPQDLQDKMKKEKKRKSIAVDVDEVSVLCESCRLC